MENLTKQQAAEQAAALIEQAAIELQKALGLMEIYDLNVENYPENWNDFNEHPSELRNILVSDFNSDVQVQVGK